jgi:uncharacterized protein (DUF433 family)/DNA-binding transcriptional MerR regulator
MFEREGRRMGGLSHPLAYGGVMVAAGSRSVLGSGAYDLLTAAHLLQVDPRTLRRWSTPDRKKIPPLLAPTHGWAFSFHDLLSLGVIDALHSRGIKTKGIRNTLEYCTREFKVARPFAHEHVIEALATFGASVYMRGPDDDGLYDLAKGGQAALAELVRPFVRPVEYGSDQLAALIRPTEGILVDPDVQVGHPCIEGTRVTTEVPADRYNAGESVRAIADDLLLDDQEVIAAISFESQLDEGRGLLDMAA